MNFKGNLFSCGHGEVVDAEFRDKEIHFLQSNGTTYMHRIFSPEKKRFTDYDITASHAQLCWFYHGGLLELAGQRFMSGVNDEL